MENKINTQALLESVCFAAFSFLSLYLVISGKYLSYVTPKMAPYLCFTSAVMLVWAISSLVKVPRPVHRTHAMYCLVLILPIIVFFLPHSQLETSGLSSGFNNGVPQAQSSAGDAQNEESPTKKFGLALSGDGNIRVSDKDFYPWLSEITENISKYEGKTVTIKGFVFKDSTQMAQDEFVPARLLMYCCSADLMPCGLLCRYDKASSLAEDTWVTVTGTLSSEEINGKTQPVITATSVSPAEKPEEEYVYPW